MFPTLINTKDLQASCVIDLQGSLKRRIFTIIFTYLIQMVVNINLYFNELKPHQEVVMMQIS